MPSDFGKHYGINVIPLTVIFGDKEYRDGIDITANQVYERIVDEPGRTATPAPKLIKDTLDRLVEEGYTHIIALHFASVLSGTYRLVDAIAKEIKGAVHTGPGLLGVAYYQEA